MKKQGSDKRGQINRRLVGLLLGLLLLIVLPFTAQAEASGAVSQAEDDRVELQDAERAADAEIQEVEISEQPTREPETDEQPEPSEEPQPAESQGDPGEQEDSGEPEMREVPELSDKQESMVTARASGWVQEADGRSWYRFHDGSYPQNKWEKIGSRWYHFDEEGWLQTGWLRDTDGSVYYLKKTGAAGIRGAMLTGWQTLGGKEFYFHKSDGKEGAMAVGWQTLDGRRFYFKGSGGFGVRGSLWTGWLKQNGAIYYLKKTGDRGVKGRSLLGWQSIGGRTFYFKRSGSSAGKLFTGAQNIGAHRFGFRTDGTYGVRGSLLTGWQTLNGRVYYFEESGGRGEKGRALLGWQKIGKYQFYFMKSEAHRGKMLTGFNNVGSARYFFKRTGEYGIKGAMLTGTQKIDGNTYKFGADGKLISGGQKTLKGFLKNAIKPMGSTLYVLGGGHAVSSGGDGVRYGLNPAWKTFFNSQNSSYNHVPLGTVYSGKGFDCSGYVGWVAYNTVNTKSNQTPCTYISGTTPREFAKRGWGTYVDDWNSGDFKAGDVVSYYNNSAKSGHVWIVIGQCSDGSVVLAHSTPPAGVILSGTTTKSGNINSEAVTLARQYMQKYFSACSKKFPGLAYQLPKDYLFGPAGLPLHRFRWSVTGNSTISDPDGYMNLSAKKILADLFAG